MSGSSSQQSLTGVVWFDGMVARDFGESKLLS
jgi:hypothetical protein